ncbi:hypothetical protein RGQ29_020500 [Quercus rubra]|uniref:Large ribosomal subunit protein bL21m n=1 Tax=Quercus rubra TaxID=3512 RepID=A0AAN7FAZ8_QUERU|nr:hypothetical protein RGQ29_020500 [Quercus rubra]
MANRRCLHALTRHASALFSTNLRLPSLPLPLPLSKTQPLKPFLAAHIFTTITPSTEYSPGKKKAEAVGIGYKLVGPLEPSDRVFKPYGPVFSVVQVLLFRLLVSFFIGSMANGDSIFTERLKFYEVNDKLILNKVLLLGSSTVHAVVEVHALDAKVIIFKKKRRKNYCRTKVHCQELTKLRITDIQGIEKPGKTNTGKPSKVAVAA